MGSTSPCRLCACAILVLGVLTLPSGILSSETGGSNLTGYPTVQAFLGPAVSGQPTITLSNRYILGFPLDRLEEFLGCLCDKASQKCSLTADIPNYDPKQPKHNVTKVTNKQGDGSGNKDNIDEAYYKCGYRGGSKTGFVECSVDTDQSTKLDKTGGYRADQNVCDFRCISFHWTMSNKR
ncbi:hypothetical protein EGW08_020502, partial [Elysia chlorotica]